MENLLFSLSLKYLTEGQQDGSVAKGTCCKARQPEFNPQNSFNGKKKTDVCKLCKRLGKCPYTHVYVFCTHASK